MTDQKEPAKKISRRDAIKLLSAAFGATMLANLPAKWSKPEAISGVLPVHAQTSLLNTQTSTLTPSATATNNPFITPTDTPTITSSPTDTNTPTPTLTLLLPTVFTTRASNQGTADGFVDFDGDVMSDGGSLVIARGFVWSTSSGPVLPTNNVPSGSGTGPFNSTNVNAGPGSTIFVRAYAINAVGTAYGNELTVLNTICLAEGTFIMLADGNVKKIEDINYADLLSVWNFDEGKFDAAFPLWIKKTEVTNQYNLLEFGDGSSLKTINQHRIFNKELGAFTYPMTEDTPIGAITFNAKGEEVTLVNKCVVNEQVNYYNVITNKHMNLFANGILTSCRYNNIYPIVGMKFVKDGRSLITQAEYGLEEKYYEGLRLAEQSIPIVDTIAYVDRLKARELETEPVVV